MNGWYAIEDGGEYHICYKLGELWLDTDGNEVENPGKVIGHIEDCLLPALRGWIIVGKTLVHYTGQDLPTGEIIFLEHYNWTKEMRDQFERSV